MSEPEINTPGRGAIIAMIGLEKDAVFKTPTESCVLGMRRKRKQKVLDEETYITELGKIIERDFFPDLEKLKAKTEYLDAVERNDVIKLRELHLKYTESARRASSRLPSPATFETPANIHNTQSPSSTPETHPSHPSPSPPPAPPTKPLSLDQYLNSHTSEDNQSFEEIMDDSERRHRAKYSYLYQEEALTQSSLNQSLTLPSIEQQANCTEKPFNLDTWTYRNRNHIMYVPDGIDPTTPSTSNHQLTVIHDNTRLQMNPFNESQNKETIKELAKKQTRSLDGKIGVDGKELITETPRINGFKLMRTPSPCPGIAESPLMTWGEIEGTPFRLDGGSTPGGPCFKMNAPPKREQLAIALAEKASERHRDKKRKAMDAARRQFVSPSPYSASSARDRLHSMSPAAQRLATSKLRVSSADMSPSTPKIKLGIRRMDENEPNADHLTDNLLNIHLPRRQTAADFF